MVEVYRNSEATGCLFLCEENARLWVLTRLDDAAYSIRRGETGRGPDAEEKTKKEEGG